MVIIPVYATANTMVFQREGEEYDHLRRRVAFFENTKCTFKDMMKALIADTSIDWQTIRRNEQRHHAEDWNKIVHHWKDRLVQQLTVPGSFQIGGDRRSTQARGAKQRAVVAYARALALAHPLDADDQLVADGVVDTVEQRYRGTTAAAVLGLRRTVRRVTRRVRRRTRDGEDAAAAMEDDEDLVDEELIEEVVMARPAGADGGLDPLPVPGDPRAFGGLAPEVVRELAALEGKRLELVMALETRRLELGTQVELKRQEVALVLAHTEQLRITQAAADAGRPRKRKTRGEPAEERDEPAPAADAAAEAEHRLARLVSVPWRNLQSLPAAVLASAPDGCRPSPPVIAPVAALCREVLAWVERAGVDHQRRLLPHHPGLAVVYVHAKADTVALSRRFWAERDAPTGAPAEDGPPSDAGYDRADVQRDVRHLVAAGVLPHSLGAALCADAAVPRFAGGKAVPGDDAGWRTQNLELRALRLLLGVSDAHVSPRDHGLLSALARPGFPPPTAVPREPCNPPPQRLPGWDARWVVRSVGPASGHAPPLRYAAGPAAAHVRRAAEVIAAVRHTLGGDPHAAAAALRTVHQRSLHG